MREYIVALHKDVDYNQFWNEIENTTQGLEFVPNRPVEIFNNRDGSDRSCHYLLTDEEASLLKNDSRIYCVEIPPDQRTDIKIGLNILSQTGDFTKPSSTNVGRQINWGLIRNSTRTNTYGSNVYPASNVYYYDFNGTGVDVVIQDSGIEASHPEFQDVTGIGRVQKINWYTAANIAGTQSANFYRDFDGHGTHTASTVAGKTFGWAKNANVYAVKVSGLEGPGDGGTGFDVNVSFDVIKQWHNNKPIDPITGYKRPTIVNASWGYTSNVWATDISTIVWRNNTFTGGNINTYTEKWIRGLMPVGSFTPAMDDVATHVFPARVSSVDVSVQEMIDAGVIFVHAAGNEYAKTTEPGDLDYNNYLTLTSEANSVRHYYHRGCSPNANTAINVGALDTTAITQDQKAQFSNTGEVYAVGTNVKAATSNTNNYSGASYAFGHTGYKQVFISGTSMACPQVVGIIAIYLERNPSSNQVNIKNWINSSAASVANLIYDSGNSTNYTSYTSLKGGPNKIAYSNTFATIQQSTVRVSVGSGSFNNISLTYT